MLVYLSENKQLFVVLSEMHYKEEVECVVLLSGQMQRQTIDFVFLKTNHAVGPLAGKEAVCTSQEPPHTTMFHGDMVNW